MRQRLNEDSLFFFRLRTDPHFGATLYLYPDLEELNPSVQKHSKQNCRRRENLFANLCSAFFCFILWDIQWVRFLIPFLCAGLEEQLIYTPKKLAEDLEGNCVYVTNKYHPKGEQIRVRFIQHFLGKVLFLLQR